MSRELLLAASAVVALACVGLLALAIIQGQRAAAASKQLAWLDAQLDRALHQIESNDADEILAGCQTLTVLNDPRTRAQAMRRLTELMKDANPRVARQAQVTYESIVSSLASSRPMSESGR